MANAIYPKWKEYLMSGGANTDLTTEVVGVALVDTGTYTYDAGHDFWNDVSAGAIALANLSSITVTDGTLDAANVTFTAVSGATVEAIVFYVHGNGTDTAQPVVAYIDTNVTGLPVTPNGGDITVNWDTNGIFTL